MNVLLAEFTVVFVLAALCGLVIGRWTVKRKFVDVTESYETIAKAAAGDVPWDMLWARFDSLDVSMRLIVREELDARLHRDESAR
jgi:hypothetical protein